MLVFNNDKVMARYEEFKRKREENRLAEEVEQLEREKRRAETQERLAKLQKALEPHPATVSKSHKCAGCKAVIPKNSRVMVEGEMYHVPISYVAGSTITKFTSKYYCNKCRKTVEATEVQ